MTSREHGDGAQPLIESFTELQQSLAHVAPDTFLEDFLGRALELARHTPSEPYFQPWRWVVVRSAGGKQQLEAATYSEVPLSRSPIVLICLADSAAWKSTPKQLQEMVAANVLSAADAQHVLRRIWKHYSASPQWAERAALANAFLAVHQILAAAACCHVPVRWVSVFDEKKSKPISTFPTSSLWPPSWPSATRRQTRPPRSD